MIEEKFSPIDDDFITLWAKYLLTKDEKLIMSDLEKLAKLGQINALQCWYKFKSEGDNLEIDNIAGRICGPSYNEYYLMHCYACGVPAEWESFHTLYAKCTREKFVPVERFIDHPCIENLLLAIKSAQKVAFKPHNYNFLAMFKLLELYKELYDLCPTKKTKSKVKAEMKNIYKLVSHYLMLEYEHKSDPNVCFCLGKLLSEYCSKEEHFLYGLWLIDNLAKREYKVLSSKVEIQKTKQQEKTTAEQQIDRIFDNVYKEFENI